MRRPCTWLRALATRRKLSRSLSIIMMTPSVVMVMAMASAAGVEAGAVDEDPIELGAEGMQDDVEAAEVEGVHGVGRGIADGEEIDLGSGNAAKALGHGDAWLARGDFAEARGGGHVEIFVERGEREIRVDDEHAGVLDGGHGEGEVGGGAVTGAAAVHVREGDDLKDVVRIWQFGLGAVEAVAELADLFFPVGRVGRGRSW